jgi:hypothetical protein
MDVASKIPVVEGGPAQRGEPNELVPGGPGSQRRYPEQSRRGGLPESGDEPEKRTLWIEQKSVLGGTGSGSYATNSRQAFQRRPAPTRSPVPTAV